MAVNSIKKASWKSPGGDQMPRQSSSVFHTEFFLLFLFKNKGEK
jgi:hypothetical protein